MKYVNKKVSSQRFCHGHTNIQTQDVQPNLLPVRGYPNNLNNFKSVC